MDLTQFNFSILKKFDQKFGETLECAVQKIAKIENTVPLFAQIFYLLS